MKLLASLILLVLLGLFLFTDDLKLFEQKNPQIVGKTLSTQGVVMHKTLEDDYFKNVKSPSPITTPSKIMTGFDSSLRFELGEPFELLEESEIKIQTKGRKTLIHLLSGSLKKLSPEAKRVEVYVDDILQKQALVEIPRPERSSKPTSQVLTDTSEEAKEQSEFQTQLKNTFRLHQRFLERCFIKYYERKKGKIQKGQVVLKFFVNPQGFVKNVEVLKSKIDDNKYQDCIKEVASRVRLKYFDKKPRFVEFPIETSLPL